MQRINGKLKKSGFGRVVTYAYDSYRYPKMIGFRDKFRNLTKDDVILIGTPTFKNLGDHLIAVAEHEFLRKVFPEKNVFEIPTHVFLRYKNYIYAHAPVGCLVVITGGGWMGNLWPKDEYNMQDMIRCFKGNTILVMPQTVYYEDDEESRSILTDAISAYQCCENLYMTFRDRSSYEFAKNNFGICEERIRLYPDIALSLFVKADNAVKRKGICLCMRSDLEKIATIDIPELLQKYDGPYSASFRKISTISNRRIPTWRRVKEINQEIKVFSNAELVITDRLHGMIFSALSGTPCIAIDNKTHKVKGVFDEWIDGQFCVDFLNCEYLEEELAKRIQSMLTYECNRRFIDQKNQSAFNDFEQFVRGLLCDQRK